MRIGKHNTPDTFHRSMQICFYRAIAKKQGTEIPDGYFDNMPTSEIETYVKTNEFAR